MTEIIEVKVSELSGADEVWIRVPGYENYEASSLGRIRRAAYVGYRGQQHPAKIKAQRPDDRGYPLVKLGRLYRRTHRIVALAFLGASGMPEVNHINGVRDDNRPENLEWCTASQNARHACETGLWDRRGGIHSRSFKGWVQATKGGEGLMLRGCQDIVAEGMSPSEVSKCLLGKRKTHQGFSFSRLSIVTSVLGPVVSVPKELV